jgi:hypothetical protein
MILYYSQLNIHRIPGGNLRSPSERKRYERKNEFAERITKHP